ncbi:MAG TPA: response regulator [Candidatus Udaeobacter sp.]|jgi:CheY-like chemotaxis protein|nr:response regulator [Candidatus Udaeobacter sp.]
MNKVIEAEFLPGSSRNAIFASNHMNGSMSKPERRILIVDNDQNSTRLVKILLEKSGPYVVAEENDATKAHQSARNFRPHVILLDIVMPEVDGGEVAAQIHEDPELRDTAIIFLTALVTRSEANSGLHIQGHPFVAKPISVPELITAIEEHLPARANVAT